jgi:hypothetical protein
LKQGNRNKLFILDFTSKAGKLELKTCAGIGCPNLGKYPLKIVYLNRVGFFCEVCKNELVQEGLATEINNAYGVSNQAVRQTPTGIKNLSFHRVERMDFMEVQLKAGKSATNSVNELTIP